MLTDLERDLRDAFAREADDVDLRAPEWPGPRSVGTPRRRWLIGAAAATVAAAGIGALWLRQSPSAPDPAQQPDTTVPAGVEVQLHPILLAELRWAPAPFVVGPMRPGSFHAFEVDGFQFVVYETIEHRGGPGVVAVRCVEDEAARTWCRPTGERPLAMDLGWLWVWPDVPNGSAFVTARTELGSRWQRPADGIAAFIYPGTLSAIDAYGRELARLDQGEALLDMYDQDADGRVYDSLERRGKLEVAVAAIGSALRCMDVRGVENDPRQPIRLDLPVDDIWAECIAVAGQAAAERFHELGGRVVSDPADDPTTISDDGRAVGAEDVEVTCIDAQGGVETCQFRVGPIATGRP